MLETNSIQAPTSLMTLSFPPESVIKCVCPAEEGQEHDFLFRVVPSAGEPALENGKCYFLFS